MRQFSPALPPIRRQLVDDSISGIVTASDYSVTEGDTVTLTFEDTSIAGEVTASDYLVTEGDTVTLEFDAVTNTYQWIDQNGDNITDETTTSTDWIASLTEQPPRIRVTNSTSGKSKVFRVDQPIVVAAAPDVNPFLASATGVYGAYGLSVMVDGYTGNAVRIRRSSDDTEQNFALVNGRVDVSAITTFLAGSIGYIVTLYDQSGNANNLTEATSSQCPLFSTASAEEGCMVWGQAFNTGTMLHDFAGTISGRNFGFGLIGEIFGTNHLSHYAFFGDGSGGTPRLNLYMNGGVLQRFHSVTGGGAGTQYVDSHRQLIAFSADASDFKMRCRTGSTSIGANAAGDLVTGQIGAGYTGTVNGLYANVFGFMVWGSTPSDATLDAIEAEVDTRYGALALSKTWVFVGDSLTAGAGALSGQPWSRRLITLAADSTIRHCNAGASGITTAGIDSAISNYTQFYNAGHTQNRAFLLAGTNDLRTGVASATTISNLTSIVSALQGAGFEVIQLTIPAGTGVDNTNRLAVNAAITGGTTGADIVVDIAADSRLEDGANSYDGLHFNDAGQAIFAELVHADI